jgi:hypothetical protein
MLRVEEGEKRRRTTVLQVTMAIVVADLELFFTGCVE